jgi:hypothetical protein
MAAGAWRGITAADLALKQNASDKLTAVANIGSSTGVMLNTSGTTAEVRALGTAAPTAIPTTLDADVRYLRWFTSIPSGAVGANGDYGILFMSGYPGVLINKSGGSWAAVDSALTHAQMLAIVSPTSGMVVNVSTITFAGDAGTQTLNAPFRYSGTEWRPIYPISLFFAADTTNVPNSSTSFLNLYTFGFPAGLIYAGCLFEIDYWIRASSFVDLDEALPSMKRHDGTTTLAPFVNVSSVGSMRGEVHGFGSAANVITWPGNTIAGSAYTGLANTELTVTSDTANGTNLHRIGYTGSASDSSKSWDIEFIKLVMVP